MTENEGRVEGIEVEVLPGPASETPVAGPAPQQPLMTPVLGEAPSSLRWSSIIGGAVAALGIGALLYSLGLALGLTVLDPRDPDSLRPSSLFTGVWAVIVPLLALFVGGFVAARGAHALTRMSGALHGLVMWGLTVVAGVWLLGNIASTLVSTAATMGREGAAAWAERGRAMPRPEPRDEAAARQRMAEARRDALRVAEDAGKASWGVFGALLLGMVSAIGGALVGSGKWDRSRRRPVSRHRDRQEPRVQRREAYP